MKLSLQREDLLKPLQMVIGAIDSKQAMPILANVLLKVEENRLSITGTDLQIELVGQSSLPINQNSPTALTLPARKLMDICKALPEQAAVELYEDRDRIVLKSLRSRFTMSTMPAEEFPAVDSSPLKESVTFSIAEEQFSQLLSRTAFAMAQQDVRYFLNGMLFELSENQLSLIATDGHRLAMNHANLPLEIGHRLQVIVPYKAVCEMMRLFKNTDQTVTVTVDHNHIRLVGEDFTFTSKLVEGRFPEYQRVIPKSADKIIIVDRDELRQALQRTAILCNEKVRGVRFELRPGCLHMFANNPEHEMAEEEVDVDYQGEPLDVGFNITYILDVLSVIQSGPVRLMLVDENTSMRIDEPGKEDETTFVIMPMRL